MTKALKKSQDKNYQMQLDYVVAERRAEKEGLTKPTEPGWYWYSQRLVDGAGKETTDWLSEIVRVWREPDGNLIVWFVNCVEEYTIEYLSNNGTWGPRIEEWMPVEE